MARDYEEEIKPNGEKERHKELFKVITENDICATGEIRNIGYCE